MPAESPSQTPGEPDVLHTWNARTLQPVVVVYVLGVFAAFIVVAHFVFRSPAGVKSLALAAVAFVVPLLANVANWVEYRLTTQGLDKRPFRPRKPGAFREVFRWEQLSRIAPVRHGFKFHRKSAAANPWRRFWQSHVSDAYSGEFHVEAGDRDAVLAIVAGRGMTV